MSFDEIFDLTAGVYFNFHNISAKRIFVRRENCFGGLKTKLRGTYVAGQRRSSPGLLLGLLVLSSHDGTCGGRRSLLFRSCVIANLVAFTSYLHSMSYWLYIVFYILFINLYVHSIIPRISGIHS